MFIQTTKVNSVRAPSSVTLDKLEGGVILAYVTSSGLAVLEDEESSIVAFCKCLGSHLNNY